MSEGSSRRMRRLFVANPDSSDEEQPAQQAHKYSHSHSFQPYPLQSYSSYPSQPPPRPYDPPAPAPLKTNLPPETRFNHPTPSPSTTSSPAQESPPQPSTPGLPAPPTDLLTVDHTPTTDQIIHSYPHERNDVPQISTSRKILQTLNPFNNHRLSSSQRTQRRPATSPTVSTPDSYSSGSSLSANVSGSVFGGGIAVAEKVIIIVTADCDRYLAVDISGAKDPTFIKERIFTKLCIWDEEDQSDFAIYRTEIGNFALGDALSDDALFELCRERGDSRGNLKFFVTHSSAVVHESSHTTPLSSSMSPTFSSPIPPPVLPAFNKDSFTPLRPKRRSRSRQGSFSSAHELMIESAGGYEADLENPGRDSHRTTLRPQQQATAATASATGNPPSPLSSNSWRVNGVNGATPRAVSPLPQPPSTSSDPVRAQGAEGMPNSGPPPPLSPHPSQLSAHDENSLAPPGNKRPHGRSGSDAAAERERALQASEDQQNFARQLRVNQGKSRTDSAIKEPRHRLKRQPSEYEEPGIKRSESWVVVEPTQSNGSEQTRSSPSLSRPLQNLVSPHRYTKPSSPFTSRGLPIPTPPRQPPPPAPTNGDARSPPPPRPPRGMQVPLNWPVSYKAEEKGTDQRTMPSSTTQWSRFLKGAKSVDSLRAAAHASSLSPGRRNNQLPVSRGSRNDLGGSSSAFIKPHESRYPTRLPVQGGPSHSSSFDLSQTVNQHGGRTPLHSAGATTSESDPYPRPQSAFGENPNSPSQRYAPRYMQSPTFTSSADHIDILRSPRALSPNRAIMPTSGYGSRPGTSDRAPDPQNSTDSFRTPPHSPTSPRSSRPSRQYNRSETTLVEKLSKEEDMRATLMPDDQRWFAQQVASGLPEGTLMPGMRRRDMDAPKGPLPSSLASEPESSPPLLAHRLEDDSDSDRDDSGTLMWQKKPVDGPKAQQRGPPLKVQIESENGGIQPLSVPSTASQSAASSILMQSQSSQSQSSEDPSPSSTRPSTPNNVRDGRGSTFIDMREYTWAPRPSPEDVYERLEEFFPQHDLDKPVIEAVSGGTSPTAADYPAPQSQLAPIPERGGSRMRSKKSIRIVAQEHKRKFVSDRTSRIGVDDTAHTTMARKRSTKLWGSRLEEVTTMQAAKASLGPPVPESPPGGPTTFKWVRGELIGKGTYGRVYLALNATTGEMIAVKQVEIPQTESDKANQRQVAVVQALKSESETLKDLDHPNIVQYLGFEETPSHLSIFLEYVPGGSIGSCLQKHGKFDEDVTKSFTGQILSGLEYLHSKGILHRDLKADNILVEKSGICKISDFGISKRTDDVNLGASTAMQGTVFWMAPEVVNTQKKGYNSKIDIWSVGCVVLEMWQGMRPWQGDEVIAVMFKLYQAKLPPPVPDDVALSPLADDFRMQCFAINPEERPTAAALRKHPYLTLPPGWTFNGFK